MKKQNNQKTNSTEPTYAYYSRVLQEPFDSLPELTLAEEAYYAKLKDKEDKAAAKKADAKKVEDAFKALNLARKEYKTDLTAIAENYRKELEALKTNFEQSKTEVHEKLAAAETQYSEALKAFTDKYEHYHLTLKDGDFETTIKAECDNKALPGFAADIFELLSWF